MSDIEKFDPAAAVNAIRDKIRGAMLEIIPNEQWNALIEAEMHAFMNDTTKRDQWGHTQEQKAGYKAIVRALLEEEFKARVKAMLGSSEWSGQWNNHGRQEAGDIIKKYVQEHTGEILNAWIGQAIQSVVSSMSHR